MVRGEREPHLDGRCWSTACGGRRGSWRKLAISPRDVAAARFIGPDQCDKREVGGPEQNNAHPADVLCR